MEIPERLKSNEIDNILWKHKTDDSVKSVSITPDGEYIVAGSVGCCNYPRHIYYYGIVYLLNKEGKLLWDYRTDGLIDSVSITPDGKYVVAGGRGVHLFNKEGKLLWKYETFDHINSISITPDGKYIVAESESNFIYLFNRGGDLLWNYKVGDEINSISITPDGKYIVAGSGDGYIYLLNKEGKLLWKYWIGGSVQSVSITPDGEHIVAGSRNSHIYLLNKEGKPLWRYETGDGVLSVSITPDGEYIVAGDIGCRHRSGNYIAIVGNRSGYVYLLNKEGELLWKYWIGDSVQSVSITPDGEYIIARSVNRYRDIECKKYGNVRWSIHVYNRYKEYNNIHLFNRKGKVLWEYKIDDSVKSISNTPDGKYIVVGSGDKDVYLLDLSQVISKLIENVIKDVKSAISEIRSKYNINEAESLLSQAEEAFNKGDYSKAKKLAFKSKEKVVEISKLAEEAEKIIEEIIPKVKLVYNLDEAFENAKREFKEGNYENAIQYLNKCKELIEGAKPKLKIELLKTSLTLNKWEKVKMKVMNEGDTIARNIIFKFSEDVTIRNLPEFEIKSKSEKTIEFYLKPNVFGEVPLEVEVRYKDHLNRNYTSKKTIILDVREKAEEITPEFQRK